MSNYNNNSIFIPASGMWQGVSFSDSGWANCWSSTSNGHMANGVSLQTNNFIRTGQQRYYGQTIRPVYDEIVHPESVVLNTPSLTLNAGETEKLIATVSPADAVNKDVTWTSNHTNVAIVDNEGFVSAVRAGRSTITAKTADGEITATCTVIVPGTPVPEAVDLGLSVKWASFNLGAWAPEVYGDYYAWGETQPKSDYSWSTYIWCNGSENTLTKYNTNSNYGIIDDKLILEASDDAARIILGASWRMPTNAEWEELIDNCTRTWTKLHGVEGRLVISNINGNSIFLPAAGMGVETLNLSGDAGYYWSASLDSGNSFLGGMLMFDNGNFHRNWNTRCHGLLVRPISDSGTEIVGEEEGEW